MKIRNIFSILITFLVLLTSVVSATEVRGTVVTGAGTSTWTAQNFAGLYYDIDSDVLTSETLSVKVNSDRTISQKDLSYSTQKALVNKTNHPDYYVVGWMGDKYVAVNGKTNKIAKLVLDMKDDEKKTLVSGQNLNLGSGYILVVQEVDSRTSPRQAWFRLMKDGKNIDDAVVFDKQVYKYTTSVLGDSDVLVFQIKIDSIFSGTEAEMIQLKYGWLIDKDSAKEIKVGDIYGVMEVTQSGVDLVKLTNENSLTLSKDSEITIMGNMKFRVADSETIRYYPKVDVTDNVVSIINNPTPTQTKVTPNPTIVPTPIPTECNPTEKIVEKIVYVTPVPTLTPETTPIKESPGFSVLLVIVAMWGAVCIILRKINKRT